MLIKITVEAALNAELEEHLGYEKHQQSSGGNSRNGFSSKHIKTEDDQVLLVIVTVALSLNWSKTSKPFHVNG